MKINELLIQNFRNIEGLKLSCHPNINVIFGKNGQGKSNLLESISCLSVGKSFRVSGDKPLIKFGQDLFYLKTTYSSLEQKETLELAYDGIKKRAKMNGVQKNKMIEFIGALKTVSFIPEDLNLIKEGSSEKRKFVDLLLCQMSKKYTLHLASYQKILEQRNKFLKEKPHQLQNLLDAWDSQISMYGMPIWKERFRIFELLNQEINHFFKRLSGTEDDVRIVYNPPFSSLEEITASYYMEHLKENRTYEIKRGYTTFGPHRDEIKILFNGYDSKIYASQGQQRLIAFALKMAEIKVIELVTKESPVLLLDDIFSELDSDKIHNILNLLQEEKRQTFITTAYEVESYLSSFEHQIFVMNSGTLTAR